MSARGGLLKRYWWWYPDLQIQAFARLNSHFRCRHQAMSFGTFPPRVHREYALFLEEIAKEMDSAEKHYVLACKSAPEDASFLISLAVFLGETRGRVKDAERVFEQVRSQLRADDDPDGARRSD